MGIVESRKLLIEIKNVYGNEVAYPVNDAAKVVAAIAKTKTLSRENLAQAKALGFTIGLCVNGREVVPA